MAFNVQHYNGNRNLKRAHVQIPFTDYQIDEYQKCASDPVYFLKTYARIVGAKGVQKFDLYGYQEKFINIIQENDRIISIQPRQMGKSQVCAGYAAWYITFNPNKSFAILANKAAIAKEIFSRVQFILEGLPFWLQQGVVEWNKTSLELENGAKCFAAASSPSAVRGMSIDVMLLDENAHLNSKLADEFTASVFPTLSSRPDSKLILISTPKGLNHFHKMWVEAEQGTNGFIAYRVRWDENPTRTQAWADKELKTLGQLRYNQEVEAQFLGSSASLIDGSKLAAIATINPVFIRDNMKCYVAPEASHSYVITVDTSRGQHLDNSAFVVFDISTVPYKIVATFKDNSISPESYPYMIYTIAKQYNDAYVLIEVNDLGEMIASNLFYEFEYENIYFTYKDVINEGRGYPGIRTTKKVKAIGCSTLKGLVELQQLVINSHDILQEMGVFVQKGVSYAAEDEDINDDLMTCLWLFAWLTKQPLFMELTDTNIRAILAKKTEQYIDENMLPFGFIDDGRSNAGDQDVMMKVGGGADWLTKWANSDLDS